MKWSDVLPDETAKRQDHWDRAMRIMRAHDAGATFNDIGNKLGVGKQRVSILYHDQKRRLDRDIEPPIVKFLKP